MTALEELKVIFASNLIRLRTDAGLTQAELAEKINYSDKSVSKWERGEALPDVMVTKQLADLFGVTVDFMLTSHDEWKPTPTKTSVSTSTITAVVQVGIWTAAVLLFIIFWRLGRHLWIIFAAAAPVSLTTLLVLNSIWNRKRYHIAITSALVISVLFLLYLIFFKYNVWELAFLVIPAIALVWLSFRIRRKKAQKGDET